DVSAALDEAASPDSTSRQGFFGGGAYRSTEDDRPDVRSRSSRAGARACRSPTDQVARDQIGRRSSRREAPGAWEIAKGKSLARAGAAGCKQRTRKKGRPHCPVAARIQPHTVTPIHSAVAPPATTAAGWGALVARMSPGYPLQIQPTVKSRSRLCVY